MSQVSHCILCGRTEKTKLFDAKPVGFPSSKAFHLMQCSGCGLVVLDPVPAPEELSGFYPTVYYDESEDSVRSKTPSMFKQEKFAVVDKFRKSGFLLDLGCGTGGFVERMKKHGWKVHAADFSKNACRLASEKIGPENVFCTDFLKIGVADSTYDVVTLWHVIEHLPNPAEVLEKIHQLLKDDGIVVICCPNFNSWLRRIFKDKWYPLSVPHHLFHWTPKTLGILLKKTGFEVLEQKTRLMDIFGAMGMFKMSLMRAMGLAQLTMLAGSDGVGGEPPKRGTLWIFSRSVFNAFCFVVSFFLLCLGNSEQILAVARKPEKERPAQ